MTATSSAQPEKPDEVAPKISTISCRDICQTLEGVIAVTDVPKDTAESIRRWGSFISSSETCHSIDGWSQITKELSPPAVQKVGLAALAIASLQRLDHQDMSAAAVDEAWHLIHQALTTVLPETPVWTPLRDVQGFLVIPLCRLGRDDKAEKLFELRIWFPDEQRHGATPAIRSHQVPSRTWGIAGKGIYHTYEIEPVEDASHATHSRFSPDTMQRSQEGSGNFVPASLLASRTLRKDMAESWPAATGLSIEVAGEELHASLVCFDSVQDHLQGSDAFWLGRGANEFNPNDHTVHAPVDMTTSRIASIIETIRQWDFFIAQGRKHSRRAEWEYALRDFTNALNLCDSTDDFPDAQRHRCMVTCELALTNRCFGRLTQAKAVLDEALGQIGSAPGRELVALSGELGMVYRHMNQLAEAKRAFELQYQVAKTLRWQRPACRAMGNLGMANYQLSQQTGDNALLDLAIEQLEERVQLARELKGSSATTGVSPAKTASKRQLAVTWESIGQSRLSLCFTARGDSEAAIEAAMAGMELANSLEDPTVAAISRFLYGRALLAQGRRQEAVEQFNEDTACSCVIALCKEPSEENCAYLRELIDTAAKFDLVDSQGYMALDYAVFHGDAATEELVLEGLRQNLGPGGGGELARRQTEAKLRKSYRELFQEKLRPVLLSNRAKNAAETFRKLRHVYDEELNADSGKSAMFDRMKVVLYADFKAFGRLPRSSDGLTRPIVPRTGEVQHGLHAADFVIFFSYRWISPAMSRDSPDDASNTQFRRMLGAVEEFLRLHPWVNRERLGIWLDHTCIDQDEPMPGVSALPMIVAQCNAIISLVDEAYFDRAWCSVEVLMVQHLRRSYGLHVWYEHVPIGEGSREEQDTDAGPDAVKVHGTRTLKNGRLDLPIVMAKKLLTYETDRPKVMFLERQCNLLG